jgi:AraC-like DNA-binding protein
MRNNDLDTENSAGIEMHASSCNGWISMRHAQRAMVFAQTHGMDISDLLTGSGLGSAQLQDGDGTVSLKTIEALLGALAQRYDNPLLGLCMAKEIQPATFGALGYIMQACSTFAEVLDIVVRYNGLMSNIGRTSVIHAPGTVEIRWDCLAGSHMFRRHASEYILGTCIVFARLLVPGVHEAISVQFSHPRPESLERCREYFEFFRSPVHFGRTHSSILVPASFLQLRLPHGDMVVKDMLERHAQTLLNERTLDTSMVDDVRRLLRALVPGGAARKDCVAQQLGISMRSLHRRLEEAGTSYQSLLDAVRIDLAREHLLATNASAAEISKGLGFSTPQSFMRWFRQLEGVTPYQYRSASSSNA